MSDTAAVTETNVRALRSKLDREEDLEILDWLAQVDHGPQHSDYLKRRQPGTGRWFLDSTKYQAWINASTRTLFCPGIPGAGKTILTAAVIEDVTARFQNEESVGIAYIYCNFNRQTEQSIEALMSNLLKQLSRSRSPLSESVRNMYNRHVSKRTQPSLQEITSALVSVVSLYSRVFVIVDALDECQTSDCTSRLITELLSLQAAGGVNLFATSRFIPQITERFTRNAVLEIRANDNDVQSYLEGRISQSASKILRQHSEEIKAEITNAVDGM